LNLTVDLGGIFDVKNHRVAALAAGIDTHETHLQERGAAVI
jgi:hypothetical protein